MHEDIASRIRPMVSALDRWIQARDLKGYDPYDLRGVRPYLWAMDAARGRSLPAKLLRGGFSVLEDHCPMLTRRLFGVLPRHNAKAMGLFAKAYLNLHRSGLDPEGMAKAMRCLDWLAANPSQGHPGLCWGYPFHWQSTVFIPEGTPSSVVSWTVADAFWTAYEVTGDRRYLDVCASVCTFFRKGLNLTRPAPGHACYSYTPVDHMHVLNATLFVGELLVRVGRELGEEAWARDGGAVADYVVSHQAADGSWPYYGREDRRPPTVDHYHTGFVLRMLASIANNTGSPSHQEALARGLRFYWENLFEPNGLPRFAPDRTYPVNVHTFAEALLCLKAFEDRAPDALTHTAWLLDWADANLRDPSGFWYFMKYPERTIRIPFMRWGQAWMLLALSEAAELGKRTGGH